MDRRAFLHSTCMACLGAAALPRVLASCGTARYVSGSIEGDDLVVPVSGFQDGKGQFRSHLIASHAQLKQPIAVFRNKEGYYSGLLMRCTHRGADLQVVGERLECAAHGSVFDSAGAVIDGPASEPLRRFKVVELDGQVRISLKA